MEVGDTDESWLMRHYSDATARPIGLLTVQDAIDMQKRTGLKKEKRGTEEECCKPAFRQQEEMDDGIRLGDAEFGDVSVCETQADAHTRTPLPVGAAGRQRHSPRTPVADAAAPAATAAAATADAREARGESHSHSLADRACGGSDRQPDGHSSCQLDGNEKGEGGERDAVRHYSWQWQQHQQHHPRQQPQDLPDPCRNSQRLPLSWSRKSNSGAEEELQRWGEEQQQQQQQQQGGRQGAGGGGGRRLDPSEIVLRQFLARGSYGSVHRGSYKGRDVAGECTALHRTAPAKRTFDFLDCNPIERPTLAVLLPCPCPCPCP